MIKISIRTFIYIVSLLFIQHAMAETRYVTDRILLGVHQLASEDSPVVTSVASGTPVNVLENGNGFTRIKLPDGTEGWVSSNYLKAEKPAAAKIDAAVASLQKEKENSKQLTERLAKAEKDLQLFRDEASNYKTTIKELQTKIKAGVKNNPSPTVDTAALEEANAEIQKLQDQVAKLEQEKTALNQQSAEQPAETDMEKLLSQNQQLQVRIEAALANLQGESVPSSAELAAIRPSFPVWYWILLIALFVAGAAGGIGWYDYQNRRKHGGFRI